jgi:hypothetical protein
MGELLEGPKADNRVIVIPIAGETLSGTEWSEEEYEGFFRELSLLGESRIDFASPARIIKNQRLKKIYFPGRQDAGNGTNPRQFLADHPEAGGIYAKTIYIHSLINNKLRGDRTRKRTALEELWKAQDSGLFSLGTNSSPGLLRSPVRKAAYSSLLESEKITREKGNFTPSLSVFDFDLDGEKEYIFQDDKLNCCVKSRGAGIFELDYLPGAWNYLDTLDCGKTGERRCAFADWLAPAGTLPADAGPDGIRGGRFYGNEVYEVSEIDRVRRRVSFRLPSAESPFPLGKIEIEKTWQLKKNSLSLEYVLKNTGTENTGFVFCPSVDLSFPGDEEASLRILSVREGEKESAGSVIRDIRALEFQDIKNETIVSLESNRGFDGRIFHVRSGFPGREEYQSTCVMPFLSVSLEGGKNWKAVFSLKINS